MKYVVQKETAITTVSDVPTDRPLKAWVDIAEVMVEKRAKRSTVIKKALDKANIAPSKDKLRLRVLDAESARVFEPEAHQPPMEWKLP